MPPEPSTPRITNRPIAPPAKDWAWATAESRARREPGWVAEPVSAPAAAVSAPGGEPASPALIVSSVAGSPSGDVSVPIPRLVVVDIPPRQDNAGRSR